VIAIGIARSGCANPVIVSKKVTDKSGSETPAIVAETPPLVGTIIQNADGTYSMEFPLPSSSRSAGRSLVNYGGVAELQGDIDYYQLILVADGNAFDEGNAERAAIRNQIWTSASNTSGNSLRVTVKLGETYHLLLLHGDKENPDDASETPLLLGSGYLKYKVTEGGKTVIIRMVPVLLDATVVKANTPAEPWAGVGNIAWVKDEDFDVTVSLRSRTATQDTDSNAPHGNALWPLLLAEARGTTLWENNFKVDSDDSPEYASSLEESESLSSSSEKRPWTGTYWFYDGVKDWSDNGATIATMPAKLSVTASQATASVSVYYSEATSSPETAIVTQPSKTDANYESGKTTGELKFSGFTSLEGDSDETDYGKFSFSQNISYIPFGIP
jgi:hypothetical protein